MILLPLGTNTGSIAVSLCTHRFYCSSNQELHTLFKGIECSVMNCTRPPREINETNPTKKYSRLIFGIPTFTQFIVTLVPGPARMTAPVAAHSFRDMRHSCVFNELRNLPLGTRRCATVIPACEHLINDQWDFRVYSRRLICPKQT